MPESIIPLPDGGKIVKTNCFECHAKCGVLCTVDKDGRLVKVKGNPEDPRNEGRMCAKGLSATRILYDPDRLRYPLKRVGERGEGKWERITWDEAMDYIVDKIHELSEKYGEESVAYGQGTGRGTNQWTLRTGFATERVNHLIAPSHVCLVPMLNISLQMQGSLSIYDGPDYDNAECIVFWGSNMVWTEPTYTSGQVGRSRNRNAKLIVIDPFFEHPLAAKADVYIGLRPGSDNALAMAWLRTMMEEGLYDREFTLKYTNMPMLIEKETKIPVTGDFLAEDGSYRIFHCFDKKSQTVKSLKEPGIEEDLFYEGTITYKDGRAVEVCTVWNECWNIVEPMTVEKAAELCWTEPQAIRDCVHTYAGAKCAAMSVFQGVEEHSNCRQTLQIINIIIAISGNLEKKGGNLGMPFWRLMGPLGGKPPKDQEKLKLCENPNLYTNGQPKTAWTAMLTGKPYPLRGYVCVQGNPLSWSENTKRVREALMSLDLLVMMDYYMSPTCQIADIVLPSTHWTERDYIADEVCLDWIFAQQKAVEPLYERRSDITFWRTLGRRLHPEWWPWETDEELFDWELKEMKTGVTWQELKDKWIHKLDPPTTRDYKKNGFPTFTGRVECYSNSFRKRGAKPLFEYIEPGESPYSRPDLAKDYPIVATTGRRYPIYYHSAYRGIPHLRELVPQPMVAISPELAREQGLKDEDEVWIESSHGKITMQCRVSAGLHPRVCVIPHGWWQGCKALNLPDYPNDSATANVLVGDKVFDKDMTSAGMRSILVRIYKKQGGATQ